MPYFENSNLKLDRASSRLAELKTTIKDFFSKGAVTLEVELDADGIHEHMMLRVKKQPSNQMALDIGEVANHLRSSLDYLACDLALINGSTDSDGIYFPIAGDLSNFNSKGTQRKISKLSAADQSWINSLKPYRGGDDMIWALNKLRAGEFHVKLIDVAARATSYKAGPMVFKDIKPGQQIKIGNMGFDLIDDGLPIHTVPIGQEHPKPEVGVNIVFRDIPHIHGSPVDDILQQMLERVSSIVRNAEKRHPS